MQRHLKDRFAARHLAQPPLEPKKPVLNRVGIGRVSPKLEVAQSHRRDRLSKSRYLVGGQLVQSAPTRRPAAARRTRSWDAVHGLGTPPQSGRSGGPSAHQSVAAQPRQRPSDCSMAIRQGSPRGGRAVRAGRSPAWNNAGVSAGSLSSSTARGRWSRYVHRLTRRSREVCGRRPRIVPCWRASCDANTRSIRGMASAGCSSSHSRLRRSKGREYAERSLRDRLWH